MNTAYGLTQPRPRIDYAHPPRMVMCKGTWPEDNYADFPVFKLRLGETDEQAISRAELAYSADDRFYIADVNEVPK